MLLPKIRQNQRVQSNGNTKIEIHNNKIDKITKITIELILIRKPKLLIRNNQQLFEQTPVQCALYRNLRICTCFPDWYCTQMANAHSCARCTRMLWMNEIVQCKHIINTFYVSHLARVLLGALGRWWRGTNWSLALAGAERCAAINSSSSRRFTAMLANWDLHALQQITPNSLISVLLFYAFQPDNNNSLHIKISLHNGIIANWTVANIGYACIWHPYNMPAQTDISEWRKTSVFHQR